MDDEVKKQIEKLDNHRARLLQTLCEDPKLFHPEAILGLVHEIRSITRVLKLLKGEI